MTTRMSKKSAVILSGNEISEAIKSEVAEAVKKLEAEHGFRPALTVVRVGEDKASEVYVGNKVKTSKELGIISEHKHLPETTSQEELLKIVEAIE